jgi:phosphopantothenoylcysteine decarboxylase/phosphopantothenate--cysteine ligase
MRGSLEEKKIVIGVTGSIAAVETVRLIHALRRNGAQVTAVMSRAAARIIHPDALTYATGRDTVVEITGMVEHVTHCGEEGTADLLLIAPCTANTLCKVAGGIDDTPITTFATTALGRTMPVIIVPAMHHSMFRHPGVCECLARLESWGVEVVPPRIEEGKAKMAGIDEIVLHCERALMGRPLAGRKILLTSGPCREPVDDIRVLTTRSTGQMGRELALQAFRLGADVTIVHGGNIPCVDNVPVTTASEMREAVLQVCREEPPDLYLSAAAISDFAPFPFAGKIRSGDPVTLALHPLPKLLDEVISGYGVPAVAFKLGSDEEGAARELLENGACMVVVNGPESMGSPHGKAVILGPGVRMEVEGRKEDLAAAIWQQIILQGVSR